MKKIILLFFTAILFSGCRCLIAQIPAQFIYAGPGCEATLPDYTPRVTASDNCRLASLVQTPAPGFLLSPTNMIVTVEIKATDNSGNNSKVSFTVALVDTIPPIITVDNELFTTDYDKMDALYRQADRMVKDKVLHFDTVFPYAELGITLPQDSLFYIVREIRLKDDNPTVMRMWQK